MNRLVDDKLLIIAKDVHKLLEDGNEKHAIQLLRYLADGGYSVGFNKGYEQGAHDYSMNG